MRPSQERQLARDLDRFEAVDGFDPRMVEDVDHPVDHSPEHGEDGEREGKR